MYAQNTDVSVEKSQAELRKILNKFGCTRFMIMDDPGKGIVIFEVNASAIRFDLPLPERHNFEQAKRYSKIVQLPPDKAYAAWEQACRSRWRALLLCVKAKLEAVEVGITTFEQEFLAHFVLPNGKVFGDMAIPALRDAKEKKQMPSMTSLLALPDR